MRRFDLTLLVGIRSLVVQKRIKLEIQQRPRRHSCRDRSDDRYDQYAQFNTKITVFQRRISSGMSIWQKYLWIGWNT